MVHPASHNAKLEPVVEGPAIARSVRGLAQLLEELDAAGVAFRSATEPFDTTTTAGRMMVQMLGIFAEFERATIVDRVIAGMERKAARGGWCGGSRPFGYLPDPATGFLVSLAPRRRWCRSSSTAVPTAEKVPVPLPTG
jgi:hypothetical protein